MVNNYITIMIVDLGKLFSVVPRDTVHRILSEYIEVEDVCRLDSAIVNKSLRRVYMSFLSDSSRRYRLSGCMVERGVSVLFLRWMRLRMMYLSDRSLILRGLEGEEDMKCLTLGLINIESLDLNKCYRKITDEGLRCLSSGCKSITSLNLARCIKITDEGLRSL